MYSTTKYSVFLILATLYQPLSQAQEPEAWDQRIQDDKCPQQHPVPLDLSDRQRLFNWAEIASAMVNEDVMLNYLVRENWVRGRCAKYLAFDGTHKFYFFLTKDQNFTLSNFLVDPDRRKYLSGYDIYAPIFSIEGSYDLNDTWPILQDFKISTRTFLEKLLEQRKEDEEEEKKNLSLHLKENFYVVKIKQKAKKNYEPGDCVDSFIWMMKGLSQTMDILKKTEIRLGKSGDRSSVTAYFTLNVIIKNLMKDLNIVQEHLIKIKAFLGDRLVIDVIPKEGFKPLMRLGKYYSNPYKRVATQYSQLIALLGQEAWKLKQGNDDFYRTLIKLHEASLENRLWIGFPPEVENPSLTFSKMDPSLLDSWKGELQKIREQIEVCISNLNKKSILPHMLMEKRGEKEENLFSKLTQITDQILPIKEDQNSFREEKKVPQTEEVLQPPAKNQVPLPCHTKFLSMAAFENAKGVILYYYDESDNLIKRRLISNG